MSEEILWCCHVRGPDDIHAAPDYETALKWADHVNSLNWRGRGETVIPPATFTDCPLKAVPAIWPSTPERHADDLPKSINGFKPMNGSELRNFPYPETADRTGG